MSKETVLTHKQMIARIQALTGRTKSSIDEILGAYAEIVGEAMAEDKTYSHPKLATFKPYEARERKVWMAHMSQMEGDFVIIPAHRRVAIKASRAFIVDMLNDEELVKAKVATAKELDRKIEELSEERAAIREAKALADSLKSHKKAV